MATLRFSFDLEVSDELVDADPDSDELVPNEVLAACLAKLQAYLAQIPPAQLPFVILCGASFYAMGEEAVCTKSRDHLGIDHGSQRS